MAGRQGRHLRGLQVRHLAHLRDRRHHRWPELRDLSSSTSRRTRTDSSATTPARTRRPARTLYDKAVTCAGNTITFKLKKPFGDFNQAVTMPAFGAYRQDKDQGDKSNYAVFSDGPYMLQGTWTQNKGGTFVRNPSWDPKTDTDPQGLPGQDRLRRGLDDETIVQRLIADQGNDKFAVTDRPAPPALPGADQSAPQARRVRPTRDVAVRRLPGPELQAQGHEPTTRPAGLRDWPRTSAATSPPAVATHGRPDATR